MFKNYLTIAWRNIVKNGVFSAINIFGLAVGLMSCILIMLFVLEEMGYDNWIKDSDRIVRLHTAYNLPNQPAFLTVRSAGRMMEAVRDYASNEIETGVRLIQWGTTVQQNGEGFNEQITMVDNSFFSVFSLPFLHGTIESSFNKPMDLVITEEMAIKYFGRSNVLGETITFCCIGGEQVTLKVTGILKDLPDATHLDINFVIYLNPTMFGENDNVLNTWTSVNVYTYFKMRTGIRVKQLQERINHWLNNESPMVRMLNERLGDAVKDMQVTDTMQLKVMAVPDLHLNAKKDAGNMGDLTPMGDQNMINTFVVVAVLILVIACINFMNLSTAKASKRAKEVAMRKVLGASRAQVAIQFLSEAVALVFIALLFALAATEVILPFYNEIIGKSLQLMLLNDPYLLLVLFSVATLVGIGAGLYPALYLSRYLPGHILKASKSSESHRSAKFRTSLVIGQFATSIILVISTIVVYSQTLYSTSVDVGYQYDNKLVLNIRAAGDSLESLKQELLNLPEVTSVSFSSESPTQDNENNNFFSLVEANQQGEKLEPLLLNYHHMDYGFFESYGVNLLAGRFFDKNYGTDAITELPEGHEGMGKASVILNRAAVTKLGFNDVEQVIGKTLVLNDHELTVIGVIPDIHFRSIKFGIRASAFMLDENRFGVANIAFQTNDVSGLMDDIHRIWKQQVPLQPMNLQFLSEMMAAQYRDETTTAQLLLVFSILAILVSCLGLYGLSAFTVERRTKEIGLRKVMGANVSQIVKLLIWQFSKPVALANLIAWPIAIYAMNSWLEEFPYRIEQWYLLPICLLVGLLSLSIAWLTVGGNAARVARKNPVHALRYE